VKIRAFAVSAVIALILAACCDGLKTARYTVHSDKIGGNIRIALLTDLHDTYYGNVLIKRIRAAGPDLILLGGDIYDDIDDNDYTRELLPKLPEIAPVYYVSGNHEIWSGKYESEIYGELVSYGITVLNNEYAELEINGNGVILAGIDDRAQSDLGAVMADTFGELGGSDKYKILLAHRPEHIDEYRRYAFDLVLSGHAHGGQVRIPFLVNGVYAPNQGLFPKYAGGLYDFGRQKLIVSRGLSRWHSFYMPRVFNRPELVVITLSQ